jgi:hypothetical protein
MFTGLRQHKITFGKYLHMFLFHQDSFRELGAVVQDDVTIRDLRAQSGAFMRIDPLPALNAKNASWRLFICPKSLEWDYRLLWNSLCCSQ